MGKGITIVKEPIMFVDYTQPNGYLVKDMRCQALWYYYLRALQMKEKEQNERAVLEGEDWYIPRLHMFQAAFTASAWLYDVEPEEMHKFWDRVEQQAAKLNTERGFEGATSYFQDLPDSIKFGYVPQMIITEH